MDCTIQMSYTSSIHPFIPECDDDLNCLDVPVSNTCMFLTWLYEDKLTTINSNIIYFFAEYEHVNFWNGSYWEGDEREIDSGWKLNNTVIKWLDNNCPGWKSPFRSGTRKREERYISFSSEDDMLLFKLTWS